MLVGSIRISRSVLSDALGQVKWASRPMDLALSSGHTWRVRPATPARCGKGLTSGRAELG